MPEKEPLLTPESETSLLSGPEIVHAIDMQRSWVRKVIDAADAEIEESSRTTDRILDDLGKRQTPETPPAA